MNTFRRLADSVRSYLIRPLRADIASIPHFPYPNAAPQLQLAMTYRQMVEDGRRLPPIGDTGFKVFSQTDEDGILLFLFAVLGTTDRRCVEICAGDGTECNTANLIRNHGWHGLLVDGDQNMVDHGRLLYARFLDTYVYPPTFAHCWVTRSNINPFLQSHGFSGEIDLLSLDIDGVDYWVWEAIDTIRPRVVVLEYNARMGTDRCVSVPYSDTFRRKNDDDYFLGASLSAFVKLGQRKGYRLVGTNRLQYNALFVRNDVGGDLLPEIDWRQCFNHPFIQQSIRETLPKIYGLPWAEI